MTKQANVTLVLDRQFGSRVASIPEQEVVWLINSEENRKALQQLDQHRRAHFSTFDAVDAESLEIGLDLIGDHLNEYTEGGPWRQITVLGVSMVNAARNLLEEYGAANVETIESGIRATRL